MAQKDSDHIRIVVIAAIIWRWGGWGLGPAIAAGAKQLFIEFAGNEMMDGIIRSVALALLVGSLCLSLTWIIFIIRYFFTKDNRKFENYKKDAEGIWNKAFPLHGHRLDDAPRVRMDDKFVTKAREVHFAFDLLRQNLNPLGVYIANFTEDTKFETTLTILNKIRASQSLSMARKDFPEKE